MSAFFCLIHEFFLPSSFWFRSKPLLVAKQRLLNLSLEVCFGMSGACVGEMARGCCYISAFRGERFGKS